MAGRLTAMAGRRSGGGVAVNGGGLGFDLIGRGASCKPELEAKGALLDCAEE